MSDRSIMERKRRWMTNRMGNYQWSRRPQIREPRVCVCMHWALPSLAWFLYCRETDRFVTLMSALSLQHCHLHVNTLLYSVNRPESDRRRGFVQEEHPGAECLLRAGEGVFLYCRSWHQHPRVCGHFWCSDLARGTPCYSVYLHLLWPPLLLQMW